MKMMYPRCYYFPVFSGLDDYESLLRSTREEEKAANYVPSRRSQEYINIFSDIDDDYVKNTI